MAPHTQGRSNVRHRHSHLPSATNGGSLSVLPCIFPNHPYQAWYIYKNIHHIKDLLSCYSFCDEQEDENPSERSSVVKCYQIERMKSEKNSLTSATGSSTFSPLSSPKKRTHLCSHLKSERFSSYVSGSAIEGAISQMLNYDNKSALSPETKSVHNPYIEKTLSKSYKSNRNLTCLNDPKLPSSILWQDELMVIDHSLPLISLMTAPRETSKIGDSESDVSSGNISPTNNLYKSELCRSWEESGSCRYGSKCQFAHGKEDLRSISRHPKYKTEICRTFTTNGTCPYGMRCRFIHPWFNQVARNDFTNSRGKEDTPPYSSGSSANLKVANKFCKQVRRLPIFEAICPFFPDCAMVSSS